MADVIATEVGVKRVSVSLVGGRYVITNPGTYRLNLNAPVSPFQPMVLPRFIDVNPAGTTDQAQVFSIIGTGLDTVTTVVAYVEGLGETLPLFIISQTETELIVANAVLECQGIGASIPFQFVFRGYVGASLVATSTLIQVESPPAPLDPMADAVFPPFTGAPGEVEISVGTGLGYALAALSALPYGPQSINLVGNGEESYTFAIWHRHAGAFPLDAAGVFASGSVPGWAVEFYNGSLASIEGRIGTPIPEVASTPSGRWEPAASDPGWHLTVLVRDSANAEVRIYLDGSLSGSNGIAPPEYPLPVGAFTFGAGGSPPGFDPTIATCAGWTRALTEPEVQLMYAATTFPS